MDPEITYLSLLMNAIKKHQEYKREQKTMKTIKVKLLEPIEGYEDVAEFRVPTLRDSAWVASTGNVCTDQALLPLATRLCLKKSQTRAERLGLEVGATYMMHGNALVVNPNGSLQEIGTEYWSRRGFNCNTSPECYFQELLEKGRIRMVIRPDGTFVDDEDGGNFVCVGGKWVSKADLRAYVVDKCDSLCCRCCF